MKALSADGICVFAIIFFFSSCSGSREYLQQRRLEIENSRTTAYECFVQLNDGTIKTYSTLRLVTGVSVTPHLLADKKTKIFAKDIIAYQNQKHFAMSAAGFSYGGRRSNLATETLPGFAVRIANGKLNVFVKKFMNNHAAADEFFLQEGNGQILPYSPELMDALIKNNPEALDFFNNNRKHICLSKELKQTAFIFNNTYFVAASTAK